MGKPTGFIEYLRELPLDRPALKRIQDWTEFHQQMAEPALRQQAARCMDCGTPFCHIGRIISGMASGCPINNLIPEWNDLVYRGLWHDALDRLHKTNNFPEFTGRVCPAPCEGSCNAGLVNAPVTIKEIERTIIDTGWAKGWVKPHPPVKRTGKKVAIVGSGPAGLCAAAQLNHAGHLVTVLERADRIGGLLMYGIPNMKLDKNKVVERRLRQMREEGIVFQPNTEVGGNYPADRLLKEFDAAILCTGATQPRDLPVEGRDLQGIHFAMDFLTANTKAVLNGKQGPDFIAATGKDVIIIGGGDTGTDCVGTSVRHGCRSLVQVEILPKPPNERAPDNPWPEWPKVYRMDYGQEEAAALFGDDPRVYLTTVKKFLGDRQGRVSGVLTVQIEWTRQNGRFVPQEVAGSETELPAQLVLLAMGFLGPEQPLLEQLGVERDPRSNVKADFEKYTTSVKGLFAAGDCRRGQSLVVWAFNEGRGAARECDRYLMGATSLP